MDEFCINGHIRTEENTRYHKRGRRNSLKRVCSDCRKIRNNDRPAAHTLQIQRTTELHEDIEDLLRFGATFNEIVARGGYSSWGALRESLKRRGRYDMLEQLLVKRESNKNAALGSSPINGTKRNSMSVRQGRN